LAVLRDALIIALEWKFARLEILRESLSDEDASLTVLIVRVRTVLALVATYLFLQLLVHQLILSHKFFDLMSLMAHLVLLVNVPLLNLTQDALFQLFKSGLVSLGR